MDLLWMANLPAEPPHDRGGNRPRPSYQRRSHPAAMEPPHDRGGNAVGATKEGLLYRLPQWRVSSIVTVQVPDLP
jgi:hypothetical protein